MKPFNETPDEQDARLKSEGRTVFIILSLMAALFVYFTFAEIARAWVWIRLAFS
jgi:hypothetical protein